MQENKANIIQPDYSQCMIGFVISAASRLDVLLLYCSSVNQQSMQHVGVKYSLLVVDMRPTPKLFCVINYECVLANEEIVDHL